MGYRIHYFIVFANELSNARISGLANTFARSSGSTSSNAFNDSFLIRCVDLLKLVQDKDYFVITTNVDHCVQKAGFDKKRLFYTQGDYGLFQCSEPCCQETFDNEEVIREMVKRQEDMKIPTELLPTCPHCGKPLTMNLRSDDTFVEDKGWPRAAERYENFFRTRAGQKILFLELGVGYNTPVFGLLRTAKQQTKTWKKRRVSRHLQLLVINNEERRCA